MKNSAHVWKSTATLSLRLKHNQNWNNWKISYIPLQLGQTTGLTQSPTHQHLLVFEMTLGIPDTKGCWQIWYRTHGISMNPCQGGAAAKNYIAPDSSVCAAGQSPEWAHTAIYQALYLHENAGTCWALEVKQFMIFFNILIQTAKMQPVDFVYIISV